MTVVYPVIFTETKDEKETVLVFIPDFNGMTEGYGIADAIGMAKDYIGNRLYDKADAEFPASTPIADVDVSKGEFSESGKPFVSLVDVDMDVFRRKEKSRMVRRNITLPEWLDEMATEAKINVSAVVQDALKERLQTA